MVESFVQLYKIEKSNYITRLQMFYNKAESTIRNLKSLNIEPWAYGFRLIPVSASKLPTDLSTFVQNFLIELGG